MPLPRDPDRDHRFGTFGGVFTPCTLTILGVIMFLRFGQVVGNAGIRDALLIVLLAKLITTTTSLSLSAIATNTRVRGGGAYYLIGRSLGVEFGGAIGVVFYLAQAISVSMYVIGFTEAVLTTFPDLGWDARVVATIVNLVVFLCVYVGASWAIKVQYLILGALALAVGAFFVGALRGFDSGLVHANFAPQYEDGESFFTMFALFFPAATGIMAGANMSGDLRDPGRSIPRGTLAAVGVTALIYAGMAVLLGASRPQAALLGDNMVVADIAISAPLIVLGIFCATLSSALGSMMGAPRILQAFARDRIFEALKPFSRGVGPLGEPRNATILTFCIAQLGIVTGDLDVIAPIITMFFMITYGSLNLATFYESVTKNPSYRPTFRYSHWSTELLGAIGCLLAMVLVSPLWAGVSIGAMVGLHHWIGRKEVLATWGDVQSGAMFERARLSLLRLEDEVYHPKNWRPSVLAFGGAKWSRARLAIHSHWLTGGRGVLTLAQVITGDVEDLLERRASQERVLRSFIREHELQAFPSVVVSRDVFSGIESLVQCSGIGSMRPNVVALGWLSDETLLFDFCGALRKIAGLRRSSVILKIGREVEDPWQTRPGTIDVWWRGRANGPLLVLLAHLMSQTDEWRGRTIRVLRAVPNVAAIAESHAHLTDTVHKARIRADSIVVVSDDFARTLHEVSGSAAIVFLGFQPPPEGGERDWVDATNHVTAGLENVILVHSSGDMELDA